MKSRILLLLVLLCGSFSLAEEADKAERTCNFFRMGEDGDHLIISRWTQPTEGQPFLLSVEPGCILLRVEQLKFTDRLCRFRIVGSPGGEPMIARAKTLLGLKTEVFEVNYAVQKQDDVLPGAPPYNRILSVLDHEREQGADRGPQTEK